MSFIIFSYALRLFLGVYTVYGYYIFLTQYHLYPYEINVPVCTFLIVFLVFTSVLLGAAQPGI